MTVEILNETQAAGEIASLVKESRAKAFIRPELIVEMAGLFGKAVAGNRRSAFALQEAVSTSDLALNALFAVLDRETISAYTELAPVWSQYVSRTTVRDFRPKQLMDLIGKDTVLEPVPELTEYPGADLLGDRTPYEILVTKLGRRYALSFESIINDQIDELGDIPAKLARAARETENRTGTGLLLNAAKTGPALTFGTTPSDLPLTYKSLLAALALIANRPYPNGVPVASQNLVLIVPPALEVTAREIMEVREVRTVSGTTTFISGNSLSGSVRIVVDPWLKVLNTGANVDTTWYLVPEPNAPRKALFIGFLRGHETPELRVKADTGNRVGGGSIDPSEGSFDIDDIQYRVRHFLGSATIGTEADPHRDMFASDGTGTEPA